MLTKTLSMDVSMPWCSTRVALFSALTLGALVGDETAQALGKHGRGELIRSDLLAGPNRPAASRTENVLSREADAGRQSATEGSHREAEFEGSVVVPRVIDRGDETGSAWWRAPGVVARGIRSTSRDSLRARVFAAGTDVNIMPASFVTCPGRDVELLAGESVDSASCATPAVTARPDGARVVVSFAADCPIGPGALVVRLRGRSSDVRVPFFVEIGPTSVRGATESREASALAADLAGLLAALRVDRASYHLRRRSMVIAGGAADADLGEAIGHALGEAATCDAWWDWWSDLVERRRLGVTFADETVEIASQPGTFKQRYLEFMPGVELTERPLADLFTAQHYLRLMDDKRFGLVVHIQSRMAYLLHDPYNILSPLPCSGPQTQAIGSWAPTVGRDSDCTTLGLANPAYEDSHYRFWMRPATSLPIAARLETDAASFAAVYEWGAGGPLTWAVRVAKVRRQPGQCTVEWLEVTQFDMRPAARDVQLRSARPAKILDHRYGAGIHKDFDYAILPEDVRNAYVIR